MDTKNYAFFQNTACEYFPCHPTKHPEQFNCLFCYCPLYCLGDRCGGNPEFLENGTKSCMNCLFPHKKDNYDKVNARFGDIVAAMNSKTEDKL